MKRHTTNLAALLFLAVVADFTAAAVVHLTPTPVMAYDYEPVARVEINKTHLTVPNWQVFKPGQPWGLVSTQHKLSKDFTPELVDTTVSHTADAKNVAKSIEKPLDSLVNAAKKAGVNLTLSSAYRSYTEQSALYASLEASHGTSYVASYVAPAGTSEHQTGLAVDLATTSDACLSKPDACSLDAASIAWLRSHAADYGFVERYPEGKQSITGIAGEHWHYRYVGVALAHALTAANMTLDEFVQQTAPAYSK